MKFAIHEVHSNVINLIKYIWTKVHVCTFEII